MTRWFWQPASSVTNDNDTDKGVDKTATSTPAAQQDAAGAAKPSPTRSDAPTTAQTPPAASLSETLFEPLTRPSTLLATVVLSSAILVAASLYRRNLKRIPNITQLPAHYIPPPAPASTGAAAAAAAAAPEHQHTLPTHSLLGVITAINDPDNFRLYHTPGGAFALWPPFPLFARRVPSSKSALKDQTLSIRLAGIDSPETAHFGQPAQRGGAEALAFARAAFLGRRVRAWVLRRDQYDRVVARAVLWRWWWEGLGLRGAFGRGARARGEGWVPARSDVGLEMLRAGWATVYEARTGVEFGGAHWERRYRAAEKLAKREKRGMWGLGGGGGAEGARRRGLWGRVMEWMGFGAVEERIETPREFKTRMAAAKNGDEKNKK